MNHTTPVIRVSYPNVFTPCAVAGGDSLKYSIVCMFDKSDKAHMDFLKKLAADATKVMEDKWPDKAKRPRIPITGHNLSPIKDGDIAENQQGVPLKENNPEYAGRYIVRASSAKRRPIIVAADLSELLDTQAIYGGCFCKVNINPYAYDTRGNSGVTFGLNGVQFIKDGDPFGGVIGKADDMFTTEDGSDDPSVYDENPF